MPSEGKVNEKAYLNRLVHLVVPRKHEYHKLFQQLYETPFVSLVSRDKSRESDARDLREMLGGPSLADRPISVLEVLIGLAHRLEDQIMINYAYGDRTGQWFWEMMVNIGLGGMKDSNYDESHVAKAMSRFMNRQYNYDGSGGGAFVVKDPRRDMRETELWYQANWYLSERRDRGLN